MSLMKTMKKGIHPCDTLKSVFTTCSKYCLHLLFENALTNNFDQILLH